MFRSIYETTLCKDYNVNEIVNGIRRASVLDHSLFDDSERIFIPYGMDENAIGRKETDYIPRCRTFVITGAVVDVPPFGHPITIVRDGDSDKEISRSSPNVDTEMSATYVDVRNFTTKTRDGKLGISSKLDYNLAIARGCSFNLWCRGGNLDKFYNLGHFPVTVYSRWVAGQLTKRLNLDPGTQVIVSVLAAYYYLCQFEGGDIDNRERLSMATLISKATYNSPERVFQLLDKVTHRLTDMQSLIDAIKDNADSLRLDDLNVLLLTSVLNTSWFGFNSREMVATAIEYPPSFLCLLYYAVTDQSYRKTIIGTVAKLNAKAGSDLAFAKNFEHMLTL